MMYLMLSVSGHLTIFQTRARGPWWSTRPARILLAAACGTQAVATLVAVYGAGLVTALGWSDAGVVWADAFGWFLLTDPVKQLAYKVLDTVKADTAPSAEAEAEPDVDGTAEPHQASEPSDADTKPPAALEPNPEAAARAPDADAKARTAAKPGDKPGDGPKDAPDAQSPPKSGSHPATEAAPRAAANPRGAAPSDPKPGDAVLSSAKPGEAKLATPAAQMSTSQAAE